MKLSEEEVSAIYKKLESLGFFNFGGASYESILDMLSKLNESQRAELAMLAPYLGYMMTRSDVVRFKLLVDRLEEQDMKKFFEFNGVRNESHILDNINISMLRLTGNTLVKVLTDQDIVPEDLKPMYATALSKEESLMSGDSEISKLHKESKAKHGDVPKSVVEAIVSAYK